MSWWCWLVCEGQPGHHLDMSSYTLKRQQLSSTQPPSRNDVTQTLAPTASFLSSYLSHILPWNVCATNTCMCTRLWHEHECRHIYASVMLAVYATVALWLPAERSRYYNVEHEERLSSPIQSALCGSQSLSMHLVMRRLNSHPAMSCTTSSIDSGTLRGT